MQWLHAGLEEFEERLPGAVEGEVEIGTQEEPEDAYQREAQHVARRAIGHDAFGPYANEPTLLGVAAKLRAAQSKKGEAMSVASLA